MANSNSTWVVVANSSHAKIFRLTKFPKIEEVTSIDHPESRLHNQDLEGRKPGRSFQSGGTTRHAYQPETEPKAVEIEKFARILCEYINESHQKANFSRLYVMASPSFLGLLRQNIHPQVQKTIIAELSKDMTERTKAEIEQQLSEL